jgi:hypothetical protein
MKGSGCRKQPFIVYTSRILFVRLEVITAVSIKISVFWDVTPCSFALDNTAICIIGVEVSPKLGFHLPVNMVLVHKTVVYCIICLYPYFTTFSEQRQS